jgi:hypothetical protein
MAKLQEFFYLMPKRRTSRLGRCILLTGSAKMDPVPMWQHGRVYTSNGPPEVYNTSAEMPLLQMALRMGASSSKEPFFTAHFPL